MTLLSRCRPYRWSLVGLLGYIQVAWSEGDAKTPHYFVRYAIVGAGTAGTTAAMEINRLQRPPPSSSGKHSLAIIDPYVTMKLKLPIVDAMVLQDEVISSDPEHHTLLLRSGATITYDKCLLAIGLSTPSLSAKYIADDCRSDVLNPADPKHVYHLEHIVKSGGHVTFIGATSFNNINLACKLASIGKQHGYMGCVSLVYPAHGVLSSMLPRFLSHNTGRRLEGLGIELIPYSQVRYISRTDSLEKTSPLAIYLTKTYDSLQSHTLYTHAVVHAPSPLMPPTPSSSKVYTSDTLSWLHRAGMEFDPLLGGMRVNAWQEVGRDMFAAGGCASVVTHTHAKSQSSDINHVLLARQRRPCVGEYMSKNSALVAARNMVSSSQNTMHIPDMQASPVRFSSAYVQNHTSLHGGLHFHCVGVCSSALPSYTYTYKTTSSSTTTTKQSPHAPAQSKPQLLQSMTDTLNQSFLQKQNDSQTSHSHHSHTNSHTPQGLYNVRKITRNTNQAKGHSATADKSSNVLYPYPPQGGSVVFFADEQTHTIQGVALVGIPIVHMNADIEKLICAFLGKSVYGVERSALGRYDLLGMYAHEIKEGVVKNQLEHIRDILPTDAPSSSFSRDLHHCKDVLTLLQDTQKQTYKYTTPSQTTLQDAQSHTNSVFARLYGNSESVMVVTSNTGSSKERRDQAYARGILDAMED
eukprot:gene25302-30552_t